MSISPNHQHQYGDWFNSGTCQRRECSCGQTETRDHSWGGWSQDHSSPRSRHGLLKRERRTCSNCGKEETR